MVYLFDMIKIGDLVLLYKDEKRNYLLKVESKKFHTDKGIIELEKLVGKTYGDSVETNLRERFFVLKPTLYELTMKVKRKTQIIYPKDLGIILTKATLFPGAKVIEVGTGSGSLTTALANFVRPNGKVYSYEKNKEFLDNAKANLEKNGLSSWVEFKHREVIDEFEEKNVDFIMIDIGSPWELIGAAYKSLKSGHRLATICPTFEQVTQTVFTLEEKGFVHIETMEVLLRRILVRRGKTRPEQKIPSHTGFLIFASKIH
ncbi:MAG: tRNA (adenine-N1)-methyltransferase [Candidatus Omnitrophota bacterium]|nr:MAG: tRNA (adenine-N1)-methyltransferase [Candidatus Omnitrophota bacterium]HDN86116.1 tRNA (adenine-N1)-methyltransferase [Candidatus Omnitrophota bacterium]